jgi:hypothetical protein
MLDLETMQDDTQSAVQGPGVWHMKRQRHDLRLAPEITFGS